MLTDNVFKPELGGVLGISVKAPQDGEVTCRVYNLAGDLVRTPFKAGVTAGLSFQASWDGRNDQGEMVSSGVYFISIRGAGIKSIRRVVVMK